jgi:formylglycine-generating enzyme required for sulfatase activity
MKFALLLACVSAFGQIVQPGATKTNAKDGQTYIWIPTGSFRMGCSSGDDACFREETPFHSVGLTRGFWLGRTEVTVETWKRYATAMHTPMPAEPELEGQPLNAGWKEGGLAMVNVTWNNADAFCKWAGGRLPTEAEWEYAARAGTTAPHYGVLTDIAWFGDNSGDAALDTASIMTHERIKYSSRLAANHTIPHNVATKQPNSLGLFDMLGGVWEWVEDWYDPRYYEQSEQYNPLGPENGQAKVQRGGSWYSYPRVLRVSNRLPSPPTSRSPVTGLRCALPERE